MVYTKIQPQSFLSYKEEFYHIWAWQPSYSMVRNQLTKLSASLDRRPHVKFGENYSRGFREDFQRFCGFIHVYSPGARADNPKIWTVA